MKTKIILIIILIATLKAFAQTEDAATLKLLNKKVIDSYGTGDLEHAAKFAKQSLELTLKVYGAEHLETAVAYTNFGVIQRNRRKFGESIQHFQQSLEIHLKLSQSNPMKILEAYHFLALSQDFAGKNKDSEASYLKAISFAEIKFGNESKQIFKPTLFLANSYARNNEIDKADKLYLQSYRLVMKHFGKESEEVDQVSDARACLVKDNKKRDILFWDEYFEIMGIKYTLKLENIVNGKAIKLVKPPYPEEAKERRLEGTVKVKVTINEQGNVSEAKAVCGSGILEMASEEAARLSKFSPTTRDGKAVKVTGIIVYNFSRR